MELVIEYTFAGRKSGMRVPVAPGAKVSKREAEGILSDFMGKWDARPGSWVFLRHEVRRPGPLWFGGGWLAREVVAKMALAEAADRRAERRGEIGGATAKAIRTGADKLAAAAMAKIRAGA